MQEAIQVKTEQGYEDIYREIPYAEVEEVGNTLLIGLVYVPPQLRGQGLGKKLIEGVISTASSNIKIVQLKSMVLGTGCTLAFWLGFGFKPVYDNDPTFVGGGYSGVLQLGINGYEIPPASLVEYTGLLGLKENMSADALTH